jgi:hypothetical protein
MILNNAPQAEAILSNVGEIGEFRIRNSAKAFNILSSGLYANKIKAIIRELSCNALDSHTAAGTTQPFEVHLPTTIEPWFSIRDFGTGLNHEQVTNIYTTYFESTKTDSNAFIGALGLGSKSPFSYTDNFTVTAIKDGRKGIYSAFINDQGVPSIALMNEEQVTEPNGVEVKFSVNDRFDFRKFEEEASSVYRWFKETPTFTGNVPSISKVEYETENIIPGVHSCNNLRNSIAVMGNIAYPIDVPQKEQSLEGLHKLLSCGLVMEFGIGELDFQASREGLSYIPQTIDSIRNKLAQVNLALTDVLAKEANEIDCKWTRSQFLHSKKRNDLWSAATIQYIQNTGFELCSVDNRYASEHDIEVTEKTLADMNIVIRSFTSEKGRNTCSNNKMNHRYERDVTGTQHFTVNFWDIPVRKAVHFIINDTKVGASERAKHHFKNSPKTDWRDLIFVLDKMDRTKDMDTKAFFELLYNPPKDQIKLASTLMDKPRAAHKGFGKNVNIITLEKRGGPSNRSSSQDYVWRAAGTLDEFDDKKTFYYIPMKAFDPQWKDGFNFGGSASDLFHLLQRTHLPEFNIQIYGVRKGDIEAIKKMPNWKPLDQFVYDTIMALNTKIGMATVMETLDRHSIFDYNSTKLVDGITDASSPAKALLANFTGLPKMAGITWLNTLMRRIGIECNVHVESTVAGLKSKLNDLSNRYPLINKLSGYANEDDVCEYINLIDKVKGV